MSTPRRQRLPWFLVGVLLVALAGGSYYAARHVYGTYHWRLAQEARARRDFAREREHLGRCLRIWPGDGNVRLDAARAARRDEDFDEAGRHLAACEQLPGFRGAAELERALLRAQRGDLAGVELSLLNAVNRGDPAGTLILEALGRGYLRGFQPDRAMHCLDQVLEREGDHARAYVWRGQARMLLHLHNEALADYRRAVELNPELAEARLRLAELLTDRKRPLEAVEQYEWLVERQPGDGAAGVGLARGRRAQTRYDEARTILEQVLAREPDHPQALAELGQLELAAGAPEAAEAVLRKAVALTPYDMQARYALSTCLTRNGKRDEARHEEARVRQIEQDIGRGDALVQRVRESPRDPALRYEVGVLFLRNGLETQGVHWLLSALQQDPAYAPAHAALAEHYERRGDKEAAARHRKQAGATRS